MNAPIKLPSNKHEITNNHNDDTVMPPDTAPIIDSSKKKQLEYNISFGMDNVQYISEETVTHSFEQIPKTT